MIIYIYGEDTFRSRRYLKESVARFKKERDPQGYNVVFLDGKKDSPGKIFTELSSAPFLAERRMIVMEDVLLSSDKDFLGQLNSWIKDKKIPESNVAVFWQGEKISKVKEAEELARRLTKEKYAREFKKMTGYELCRWVNEEIKARGDRFSRPAVDYLCANAGDDVWLLNSLIDELAAYAGGAKEVVIDDVLLFLDEKVDDNIFNLIDAIAAGNKKLAFKLLEGQRRDGEDDGYIFAMLLRQYRILLMMRDLIDREDAAGSDEMAKRLGLHPFVVRKSLPLARRHSMVELKKIHDNLLDIDIKTKTGRGDQSLLIDLFVGSLS